MANYLTLSVRIFASKWGWHFWVGLLLTDALFLVPVPVSLLRKGLVTKRARVGARIWVRAHVILHIGKLVKLFVADFALHLLILATCLIIENLHSPPQFLLFSDCLVFETWYLRRGNVVVFSQIFCNRCWNQLRAKHSIKPKDVLRLDGCDTFEWLRPDHDRVSLLAEALLCDLKAFHERSIHGRAWRWWLQLKGRWRFHGEAWCQRKALLEVWSLRKCLLRRHVFCLDWSQFLKQVNGPRLRLLDCLKDTGEKLILGCILRRRFVCFSGRVTANFQRHSTFRQTCLLQMRLTWLKFWLFCGQGCDTFLTLEFRFYLFDRSPVGRKCCLKVFLHAFRAVFKVHEGTFA